MRTDRTYVCTDCRIRCWPVRRCPGCGETRALSDLAKVPDAIARSVEPPPPPAAPRDRSILVGLGVSTTIGGVALGLALMSLAVAEVAIMIGLPLIVAGSLRLPRRARAVIVDRGAPFVPLECPVVRDAMLEGRREVRGVVRARGRLVAPLSGRECIAYRLVGEGRHGLLDDALGGRFEVVLSDGSSVEVDGSVGTFDLPISEEPLRSLETTSPELDAWLAARGADRTVRVRESILEGGDLVEVIDVLADLPGSPLIVRAASPEAPAAPRSIA
jgi:hypothetical protein